MIWRRPIFIICQEGVPQWQIEAVCAGVQQALDTAKVSDRFEVRNLRSWREPGWTRNNRLIPHQSVDWYVHQARVNAFNAEERSFLIAQGLDLTHFRKIGMTPPNSLLSDATAVDFVLEAFRQDPYRQEDDRYTVMVVRQDEYSLREISAPGATAVGIATLISAAPPFADLAETAQHEQLTTETARQVTIGLGLILPIASPSAADRPM